MSDAEIVRLSTRLADKRADDVKARATDAARHLRLAIELLEGAAELPSNVRRAAELMLEAADSLLELQ